MPIITLLDIYAFATRAALILRAAIRYAIMPRRFSRVTCFA